MEDKMLAMLAMLQVQDMQGMGRMMMRPHRGSQLHG